MKGVQIEAAFPTLLMKASAAALFAGGRGIEFAIQAYIVPFMAKMKISRNSELYRIVSAMNGSGVSLVRTYKYRGPNDVVNMKMKQPTSTRGTGYM